MINSISKAGRPRAVYRTSWGEQIVGLFKLADGRWRVSGKEKQTYSEADERLAVARFREIENKRQGRDDEYVVRKVDDDESGLAELEKNADLPPGVITIPNDRDDSTELALPVWAWLRKQILTRPAYVAQMTGIEQIAYLSEIKKPTASQSLEELGNLYAVKPGLSSNEAGRSKLFWKEFRRAVGVDSVREITYEHIAAYEKAILGKNYAPKSILHRYRKVRTILAYAIKRGRGVEDCRRALDISAMLEVKNHTPLDPRPISPKQFWAVHAAATEAGDTTFAAMMLVALNAAMYAGEVSALRWDEVNLKNGELVTRRPKTGVSRIGVLWPQTLAALKKLPREGDAIFYSARRSYYANAVVKVWRRYCEDAKVGDDVVFSMLRDAAYSTACSISVDQAKLLAGHRLAGASDHYVRRNPELVAAACAAIRTAFYALQKSAGAASKTSKRRV